MEERVNNVYQRFLKREYRNEIRSDKEIDASLFQNTSLPYSLRSSKRLHLMCEAETPVVYKEDRIGFYRTIKKIPALISDREFKELSKEALLFDGGIVCNISSDYETTLNVGFDVRLQEINTKLENTKDEKARNELLAMKESIESVYLLVDKYQRASEEKGNKVLSDILKRIPRKAPSNYHEACVFLRIMNYFLWLNGNKHNTLGRFDQYMFPFYKKDIDDGVITKEEALSLTQELFVSFNFDADLFPGVQQGDNGQSLVLGGVKKDGSDAFNELTEICLKASLEFDLIDPKINLRVNKNTDMKWFELGTLLTKKGLGFPQYSNDDVVIPALTKMGYRLEDAREYVVAACWEFIIPGYGMDIPNIDCLSFPECVDKVVHSEEFLKCTSYEEFEKTCLIAIDKEVKRLVDCTHKTFILPSPYQSILMKDCVENTRDIADGGRYNNYGFHGAGISNASDAMAAIKLHIFENKDISKEDLLNALEVDFKGYEKLQKQLISAPKMGNNDDYVDSIATKLLDRFSKDCSLYKNDKGGIYRAGTGTAMYYIWFSEKLGATADGRNAYTPFAANYSPSLFHNFKGVLSVVQSFTKPNLEGVCNGGPLTLEFHDTLFRNQEGVDKVAQLVKSFVLLKGHQMQLNAINRETLLDAQKHPEDHKNLIVRVWGWSGYFNELDLVYQNHIISRLEFTN